MKFELTTFGSCRLETGAGQLVRAPAQSLIMLAYLYDMDEPVARRDLANLLWPGSRDSAATNLRSTLLRLTDATGAHPALVRTEGSMLSINYDALACDLELAALAAPVERLRTANDAVAKNFLPQEGNGKSPLDIWVRDVRARMASHLRSEFFQVVSLSPTRDARSELNRAAILLLEVDPYDDEVRQALTEGLGGASRVARNSAMVFAAPVTDPAANMSLQTAGTVALPRIALLPPMSAHHAEGQRTLAHAMIEDLTIGLCASRAVSVVAPFTSERIQASRDKAAILEQHRVVYVLDTKKADDQLFVQLIFMPTDEVVWATRIELSPGNAAGHRMAISGAIQQSIIDRIGTGTRLVDDFCQKPHAYFSYLRGLQALSTLTLPSIRKARRHFRQALEKENDFSAALAGVSRTLTMEWVLTAQGDRELLQQAELHAQMAIRENAGFAGGFKELGVSQLYLGKIDESLGALDQAEAISPHYADALWSHADSLVHASNPAAALAKVRAAMELNPMSPDTYFWTAAGACYFLSEYRKALAYIDRMNDSGPAARLAAACWGMLGDAVKARACRLRALKNNPYFDLEQWLTMIPHKEPWQTEHYREGLIKAGF